MKCPLCGGKLRIVGRTHDYRESGLIGLTLEGVEVRECPSCGEREVAIPNIEGLHRVIARALATRASQLRGAEVRFLRKWLGYSGQDFARLMGVTVETVSRWENERRALGPGAERALRLLALHGEPVESYDLEFLKCIAPAPARRVRLSLALRSNHWQPPAA